MTKKWKTGDKFQKFIMKETTHKSILRPSGAESDVKRRLGLILKPEYVKYETDFAIPIRNALRDVARSRISCENRK